MISQRNPNTKDAGGLMCGTPDCYFDIIPDARIDQSKGQDIFLFQTCPGVNTEGGGNVEMLQRV